MSSTPTVPTASFGGFGSWVTSSTMPFLLRGWYRPTSGYSAGDSVVMASRRAVRGPDAYSETTRATRFRMLSSDPASQYCMARKYTLRSWALPGMNRRIRGRRFSMRSCFSPSLLDALPFLSLPPRSFFSSASGPFCGALMSRPPIFVRRITSAAEMKHSMASTSSRRACRCGSTAWMCSSTNSMQAITTLALPMACWQAARAPGLPDHSPAQCRLHSSPGATRLRREKARSAALDRCPSRVIRATCMGASAPRAPSA